MSRRSLIATILITSVITAIVSVSMTRAIGQSARPARTTDGKPNLSGIWQANNEANWDLQPHEARAGAVTQRGVYPYAVSYTHLRAHETPEHLVCRLLLEK